MASEHRTLACLCLCLCLASALSAQSPEPDRRIEEAMRLLGSDDIQSQRTAIAKLTAIGEPAVPALVAVVRQGANVQYLSGPTRRAAHVLDRLGKKATAALPDLVRDLFASEQHYTVLLIRLIGRIGPFAPKEHASIRRELLARYRRKPHNWLVRESLFAYHRLTIDPDAPLEDVIRFLYGKNPVHREMAAEILADRGRAASGATAHLQQLLLRNNHPPRIPGKPFGKDYQMPRQPRLQNKIAYALMRVCPRRHVHVKAQQLLSHEDPMVRLEAALALGSGGTRSVSAVTDLELAMYDDDRRVAWAAITALGMIGPKAAAAVPELKRVAESDDPGRRVRARVALSRICE